MTQMEVLYAGPGAYQAAGALTTGYVAAAASATTEQVLVQTSSGASGAGGFSQPYLPAGFFQQGRQNQLVKIVANGVISWVSTALTTATFKLGFQTTAQGGSGGVPSGSPNLLITSIAIPNNSTAQTNVGWRMEVELLATKVGIGTTAVATAVQATGWTSTAAATAANCVTAPMTPQAVTTIDSTVNNFIYASVTFGTNASASNSCTLLSWNVFGCN